MAVEGRDAGSGDVVFDPQSYDAASKAWVRNAEPPDSPAPSAQEPHKAFSAILDVSQDKQTGYLSLSMEHQSPMVAAAQRVIWRIEDVTGAVKA